MPQFILHLCCFDSDFKQSNSCIKRTQCICLHLKRKNITSYLVGQGSYSSFLSAKMAQGGGGGKAAASAERGERKEKRWEAGKGSNRSRRGSATLTEIADAFSPASGAGSHTASARTLPHTNAHTEPTGMLPHVALHPPWLPFTSTHTATQPVSPLHRGGVDTGGMGGFCYVWAREVCVYVCQSH